MYTDCATGVVAVAEEGAMGEAETGATGMEAQGPIEITMVEIDHGHTDRTWGLGTFNMYTINDGCLE